MLNGLPYQQYITYIEMMDNLKLELAAEYLVMVALLVEIKSRMLLPEHKDEEQEEEEPRAYLMCKLMAYEFIKNAADALDKLPREECDTFATPLDVSMIEIEKKLPSTQLKDLVLAFHDVLQRVEKHSHHHISREVLATRERMSTILENLKNKIASLFQNYSAQMKAGKELWSRFSRPSNSVKKASLISVNQS